MIKKFGVLLSLFTILFVGNTFADILPNNPTIPEEECMMFESVKVGNGRIISVNKDSGEVKEEHEKECFNEEIELIRRLSMTSSNTVSSNVEFYVLDNNIDVSNILLDNVEDKAEKIMVNRSQRPLFTFIGFEPIRHEYIYQVVLNGSGLYETQLIGENRINIGKNDFSKLLKDFSKCFDTLEKVIRNHPSSIEKIRIFGIARFLTIIVEIIILFIIARLHWKNWIFKNGKLITVGVLASTVTLPLLGFVLPTSFGSYGIAMIVGELLIIVIETFIIKYSLKIKWGMAIFVSIVCNLCSFLIGLFIF